VVSPAGASGPQWLVSMLNGGVSLFESVVERLRPERFG